MKKKGLRLEELEVYKVAMEIGDIAWDIVAKWNNFEKLTFGSQFVRAADSIAYNISEGYGRFHYKENKNFCYYNRGSAKETSTAIHKAIKRKMISETEFTLLSKLPERYFRLMHGYIKSIGQSGEEDNEL
jgi:four helix bundle protein